MSQARPQFGAGNSYGAYGAAYGQASPANNFGTAFSANLGQQVPRGSAPPAQQQQQQVWLIPFVCV